MGGLNPAEVTADMDGILKSGLTSEDKLKLLYDMLCQSGTSYVY